MSDVEEPGFAGMRFPRPAAYMVKGTVATTASFAAAVAAGIEARLVNGTDITVQSMWNALHDSGREAIAYVVEHAPRVGP